MSKIVTLFLALLLVGTVACQPIVAPDAEMSTGETASSQEVAESVTEGLVLTGRSFEYRVDDYLVRSTFVDENQLHSIYVEAPEGEVGVEATETITRVDVRDDVVLMSWQEAAGPHVIDLLDLSNMALHSYFITPEHEFSYSVADVVEVTEGANSPEPVEVVTPTELTGLEMNYVVGDYHIELKFEGETQLRWEYVAAPEADMGKFDNEELTRVDVREDLILLSWQEATGVYVIDVFDLANDKLYSNFVTPSHEYFNGEVDINYGSVADQAGDGGTMDENILALTGRAFEYSVGDYHIFIEFLAEDQLRWEYVEAPEGDKGKTDTEEITRVDVRDDILLMSWKEATGVYVIDVLDLGNMKLYSNFVTPEHEFNAGVVDVVEASADAIPSVSEDVAAPELAELSMEYSVGDYHIRVDFQDEAQLRWEYVEAPGEDKGKNDVEDISRTDVRSDLVLMSWQEATGVYVIDLLDLANAKMYSNFVTPDHEFFNSELDIAFVD